MFLIPKLEPPVFSYTLNEFDVNLEKLSYGVLCNSSPPAEIKSENKFKKNNNKKHNCQWRNVNIKHHSLIRPQKKVEYTNIQNNYPRGDQTLLHRMSK